MKDAMIPKMAALAASLHQLSAAMGPNGTQWASTAAKLIMPKMEQEDGWLKSHKQRKASTARTIGGSQRGNYLRTPGGRRH